MAHPHHHALSSVRKWGGKAEDYLPIHDWFDESKASLPDFRHRALRHHSEGIFLCEAVFGATLTNSDGKVVPVRWVGEQHVKEDLGRIPTAADWLREIRPQAWMGCRAEKLSDNFQPAHDADPGQPDGFVGKKNLPAVVARG
jgi:hypothetical protein